MHAWRMASERSERISVCMHALAADEPSYHGMAWPQPHVAHAKTPQVQLSGLQAWGSNINVMYVWRFHY